MAKASKTTVPGIHIGIGDKDRAAIAQGLSHLLADTYTLYLTTHNFHWNVTGPMFNTLAASSRVAARFSRICFGSVDRVTRPVSSNTNRLPANS